MKKKLRGIKNEDAYVAALLIWKWVYDSKSKIPDATMLQLLRGVCKSHDLAEVGRAYEKLERDGKRSGEKIRYLAHKLGLEKEGLVSARDIRLSWPSIFGGKPPSERTIRYALKEGDLLYVRLKPWQQPK